MLTRLGFALLLAAALTAQTPPKQVTAAQYTAAEQFLSHNVNPLVLGGAVRAHWLPDGRFWYSVPDAQGPDYTLVDPAKESREPAFDRAALAQALSAASGHRYTVKTLDVTGLTFSGNRVTLTARGKRWQCERSGARCEPSSQPAPREPNPFARFGGGGTAGQPPLSVSPNGKLAVYIKDWNLWLRNLETKQDTQLTFDGVKNFGYATDNAGWTNSERAIVLWSPDSTKIATYQQDQRGVGNLYLVPVVVGHPKLVTQVYPLPGDKTVTTIQRVIIDVAGPGAPKVIRLKMPPDQHRSTIQDDLAWGPHQDVQWNQDGTKLLFVSTSRGHKHEWVRLADAATGNVQTIFEDTVRTQYEGGQGGSTFRYLPERNGFLWFSQKEAPPAPGMAGGTEAGLGQLYLYGLDGQVEKQITAPSNGNVDSVVHLDRKNGWVYYIATAVPGSVNPYYQHLYRASLKGGITELLTPEDANHVVSFSPSGDTFVDTYSTPDDPPVSVLRSDSGRLLMRLQTTDISRLQATGWKPPIQVKVKGRDGVTDVYGLMYTPFTMQPGAKYPIINNIYPGPQTGSVAGRNFEAARGDAEALAQLGFVVVQLDGMGTPWRGQKFHDTYYGNMKDNTLPDQVAGMKELAQKYPFIDITRAGIWGHSGGGDATADAMFRYPDFFKVGIAESGNHNQLEYEDDWGERYQGLVTPTGVDDETNYTGQDNASVAKNLQGHLMLTVGSSDNNVPMNNTLLVVEALIKANKDFKLIIYPNAHHGYGDYSPYQIRQRWDFFVRYLMGAIPPHEFLMAQPRDRGF